MTKEEAIEVLKALWRYKDCGHSEHEIREALDMAIKALGQEPVLDKIRAEIDGLTYYWCEVNPRTVIDDVIDIIDKYKVNKHESKPNIKALGEDMRICQKSITDEKVLIGFNMAVAICNKHLTESEVKNESLHDESNG